MGLFVSGTVSGVYAVLARQLARNAEAGLWLDDAAVAQSLKEEVDSSLVSRADEVLRIFFLTESYARRIMEHKFFDRTEASITDALRAVSDLRAAVAVDTVERRMVNDSNASFEYVNAHFDANYTHLATMLKHCLAVFSDKTSDADIAAAGHAVGAAYSRQLSSHDIYAVTNGIRQLMRINTRNPVNGWGREPVC
jgi:NurA-like 5'-3' nuclease